MPETNVVVTTSNAAKYAAQLVKHWGHRNPQVETGPQGTAVTFGSTTYLIGARSDALVARITAADADALAAARRAFQEHIDRFAFREAPALVWDWR